MIEIGRFAIVGDWDKAPTPEGKLRIIMPPLDHVYGGGFHLTTQNSLLALPEHVKPGSSFLELGAGSCILSIAAEKLGARRIYATECSPDALKAGRKVLAANHSQVQLSEGTFIEQHVDVAVVSISTKFAQENASKIKASKILIIHDDATVEVLNA